MACIDLKTQEHDQFLEDKLAQYSKEQKEELRALLGNAVKSKDKEEHLKFLEINSDFKASYYIGCAWLIPPSENEKGIPIQVEPKIENIDFIRMFVTALEVRSSEEAEYFSDYYHIDFESPVIQIESEQNLITPLLLLHYITLLEQLARNGLRKNYVRREENLQSKIRGKILFNQHLKQNVFNKREDRIFCGYQEYTIDTPENRLLKKALVYAKNNLESIPSLKAETLDKIYSKLAPVESAFEGVSEDVSLSQVYFVKSSKLYRHYDEAIKVAKMILRGVDYEILEDKKERDYKVHPFYIDMPRLYEMYVLSLLRKAYGDQIKFQERGRHGTKVDFIKTDEKIIMDAKYKPRYESGDSGIVDDVREISGYARDKSILKALNWYKENGLCVDGKQGKLFPDCVIVYPVIQPEYNDDGEPSGIQEKDCVFWDESNPPKKIVDEFLPRLSNPIAAFEGFYKIAIPLPKK